MARPRGVGPATVATTRRIYSVEVEGLMELRRYLETFWNKVLRFDFWDITHLQDPKAYSGSGVLPELCL